MIFATPETLLDSIVNGLRCAGNPPPGDVEALARDVEFYVRDFMADRFMTAYVEAERGRPREILVWLYRRIMRGRPPRVLSA